MQGPVGTQPRGLDGLSQGHRMAFVGLGALPSWSLLPPDINNCILEGH